MPKDPHIVMQRPSVMRESPSRWEILPVAGCISEAKKQGYTIYPNATWAEIHANVRNNKILDQVERN